MLSAISGALFEIDYMEYASDSAAQGAYVTSATAYTAQYPTAQSDTYVKATSQYSGSYVPYYSTDPAISLIGTDSGQQWLAVVGTTGTTRFHIDVGSAKIINRIYYENAHASGGGTTSGVNNFILQGSNTGAGTFDDLVYANDEGWATITGLSQNTFDQHVAANQADPKYITISGNTTAYRYYAIKMVDNHGSVNELGIRHIELQTTALNSFSEDTIITQGSYALKLEATTDSLNETVTRPLNAPSGGTVTTDGSYTVHTFTSDGIMTFPASGNVQYLVVGGGGGGGGATAGGGGGGGFRTNGAYDFAVTAKGYAVKVGAGGVPSTSIPGRGGNSVFSTITAIGGGSGGHYSLKGATVGGSGGGGCGDSSYASVTAAAGTASQGYAGGNGYEGGGNYSGGGGGGASEVGYAASGAVSGAGGDGTASSISGASVTYAGGGGGGYTTAGGSGGAGGAGGGGSGTAVNVDVDATGTPNTGGGAGGGPAPLSNSVGGSGIVIIKYLTSAFTTVDSTKDLTGKNTILMDVRSTDTGSNLAMRLSNDGGDSRINASFVDEDCSALGSWVDGDTSTAVSSQITFDSQETFKFDTGASAADAKRTQDFGSLEELGNRVLVKVKVYHDSIGSISVQSDSFNLSLERSDWVTYISFGSDGLMIWDGAGYNEVGSSLVVEDAWQTWLFDFDFSSGVASAVVDVYLEGILQATDFDCSSPGSHTDGNIEFMQRGHTIKNRLSYVDYIKIGSDFDWITHNIDIVAADTYQAEVVDISDIADADKDDIDLIQFKVLESKIYPLVQNGIYVKATSDSGATVRPWFATDPALTLTGVADNYSWATAATGSQRFHIDLGNSKIIDRIYYENYHYSGGDTARGIQNFTLWGSDNAAAFAELTYGTDTNWTQITGLSQTSFDQHAASDAADPKYITFANSTAYRYYAIKCVDNYGDGTYIGLRYIELQGSKTYYIDNIRASADEYAYLTATGGTITYDGDYKIHTFTEDGTFDVKSLGSTEDEVEYLVVGGGGAGGGQTYGGGGGGGDYRTASAFAVTAQAYGITVGAGGVSANADLGTNGGSSIFSSITAIGGGSGGGYQDAGADGASGGGGGGDNGAAGGSSTGVVGFDGGDGYGAGSGQSGGGGGGASEAGPDASSDNGTAGGEGLSSSISGSAVVYASGGGSGTYSGTVGVGGTNAGNGANTTTDVTTPVANTGSGGGGACAQAPAADSLGSDGSSGIVIIRYQYK